MKEYKSNEELLNYLISKGIKIKNKKKTLERLERYTYYSIVNTYKEVFKRNGNYIDNVTFEEIFALYEFDKNLKAIFLKYALEIETVIKSLIANTIAEKYGVEKYLELSCFDTNTKSKKNKVKNFLHQIDEEIKNSYGKHPALTHYKDNYGFIPPFVLVKILTLGEISRYYMWLQQSDRQKISKYFKLSDKVLSQVLFNLSLARNHSAHNNKLYTFHSRFFISFNQIDNNYQMKDKSTNFYMLMKCMSFLLDKNKYNQFTKQVNSEIKKLGRRLYSISIDDILNIMGFPNV